MFCCAFFANAQDVDTTFVIDTGKAAIVQEDDFADGTTTEENQPRTVTYNKEAPTEARWQQVTADRAFGYKTEKEFTAKEQKPRDPEMPWLLKVIIKILQFFSSLAGKLILAALLIALIGYILYRIIAGEGRFFARKNKTISNEEEPAQLSEEDLLHNNWEERLRAAISSGDQRMAIRYSYLRLLQLLQARDLIFYRQDKTNTAYYHELSGHAVRNSFRQITREYEYAWYGNFLPSPEAFEAYLQTFNGVKKELGAS